MKRSSRLLSVLVTCALGVVNLPQRLPAEEAGVAKNFHAVVSHLDTGGQSFQYFEPTEGSKTLWDILSALMVNVPAPPGAPDPQKILPFISRLLALDAIQAQGSSGVTRAGMTHRRSFALVPGDKPGITGVFGKASAPFLAQSFPAEADLALELELDLRELAAKFIAGAGEILPEREVAEMRTRLDSQVPGAPFTVRQLLDNAHLRLAFAAWLRPQDEIPVDKGMTIPGADAMLAVAHAGWLIKPFSGQIVQQFQQGGPIQAGIDGTVITLRFIQPVNAAPLDFQPIARYDSATDLLVLATRPAVMEAYLAGKNPLGAGAEFKTAASRLPAEGNAMAYVSSRLLKTLADLTRKAMTQVKMPGNDVNAQAFVEVILNWLIGEKPVAQAAALAVVPDGLAAASNTTFVVNQSDTMTALATVSVLASMAVPAYSTVQARANTVKQTSNARQLAMGLRAYAGDHDGNYPDSLEKLFDEQIFDANSRQMLMWQHPQTKIPSPWIYRKGLTDTSPNDAIVIAAPEPVNGKRVVGFNDGSVREIPEAEYQAAVSKQ